MPVRRSAANPIITRSDLPAVPPQLVDPSTVFNPGAIKHDGRYHLLLRVQTRGRETLLLSAVSNEGVSFEIAPHLVQLAGIEQLDATVYHLYDPRLTRIDDTIYVMLAMDMDGGCRLGVARTDDLQHYEFLGITTGDDIRNGVLFPERRADGRFMRLDRPNRARAAAGPSSGNEIMLSTSSDLLDWETRAVVARGRPHYWDELIGPGPPPVKTRQGWLLVYHGIATHFAGSNIYQAGALLLDLDDPGQVVARSRNNLLEPRADYEQVGQVPNVIFPSGMIVDEYDAEGFALPDSRVLLYYGAADTVVALATTTVAELVAACSD